VPCLKPENPGRLRFEASCTRFQLEAKDLGEMNSICNSLQWQMNICIVKAVFKSENPFSGFAFNAEQESLRLFFA